MSLTARINAQQQLEASTVRQIVIRESDLSRLDWLSQLVDAGEIVVIDSHTAFEGRERVIKYVSAYPQYVHAVLARLMSARAVLWYT